MINLEGKEMTSLIITIKRKIGKPIKRIIGDLLKLSEKEPYVIMYIDGGFSSQMLRYSKGMWFKEHGMKVKFDLQWYEKNGMDDLGIEKREWRLSECFPDLKLEVASDREIRKYRKFYGTDVHDMVARYKNKENEMQAPLYVSLYDFDYLTSFKSCTKYFEWEKMYDVLSESAKKTASDIKRHQNNEKKVIGVHVRRGDMVVTKSYWKVLTPKYFEVAIGQVATDDCIIYLFSNGFDFVRESIVPLIKHECVLVNNNTKDYEDIYLYSMCNVQIASQGSWGELAYCFNVNENRTLVIPDASAEHDYDNFEDGIVKHIRLEEDMYIHG